MSELVSELARSVLQPVSLVLLFGLAALVLSLLGRPRLSQATLLLSIVLLAIGSFTSLGQVLLQPLESRFEFQPPAPPDVTGIIVLGGGMNTDVSVGRGGYAFNRSGDRFVEVLRLARLHPEARILITGGGGSLASGEDSEAATGARLLSALGIEPDRLILEPRARNTYENARFTKERVEPRNGETWLLLTSAFHMPRAVGVFREAGFPIIPWPTDYNSTGAEQLSLRLEEPLENLANLSTAMREWLALAVYYLAGRTDQLLPEP